MSGLWREGLSIQVSDLIMAGRAASWTSGPPNFAERKERAAARRFSCLRSTKSAPPLTGKPVAYGDPRPSPARHEAEIPSSKPEGEGEMITLYDHIQELRVELRECDLTPRERHETQAELARAEAEQAALDRPLTGAID